MTQIEDYQVYNDRMRRSMWDKAFFMDKVPGAELILDYGCADGSLVRFLSELFPAMRFIGFDIDPVMIAAANAQRLGATGGAAVWGAVADVKVFGVPDDFWGEIVAAAIVMKEGRLDESALRSALKGKLAKFKIPAHFLEYDEFPLLPNGKVDMLGLKNDVIAHVNARKTDG